jgi:hypothetical protein
MRTTIVLVAALGACAAEHLDPSDAAPAIDAEQMGNADDGGTLYELNLEEAAQVPEAPPVAPRSTVRDVSPRSA